MRESCVHSADLVIKGTKGHPEMLRQGPNAPTIEQILVCRYCVTPKSAALWAAKVQRRGGRPHRIRHLQRLVPGGFLPVRGVVKSTPDPAAMAAKSPTST